MTTENDTTWQLPTEPVIPAGVDPLDKLTIGELGTIGKLIKYDPASAVKRPEVGLRWPALAHIAWVWARRTDPKAKLQPFLDCDAETLGKLLRFDEETDPEGEGEGEGNPTDSTPA